MGLLTLLISSIVSGVIGTLIGAIISVMFGKKNDKTTAILMCFAGGVMLSIVCFDLIPEAIDLGKEFFGESNQIVNLGIIIISIAIGVLLVITLSKIVDKIFKNYLTKDKLDPDAARDKKMIQAGIMMLLAIGFHNFPEGLAIGASQSISASKGLVMAILIALHNIPEGIAMVAPLKIGGMKTHKILLLAAATGVPTVLGAFIGYFLGNSMVILNAICIGIAGGSMLYIIFAEMLREAFELDRQNKVTAIVTVISIVLGLVIVEIL